MTGKHIANPMTHSSFSEMTKRSGDEQEVLSDNLWQERSSLFGVSWKGRDVEAR
jgi:hypothetical protein